MTAKERDPEPAPVRAYTAPWKNSIYDEPTWVSLFWIVIPVGLAALGIFFAMK
jgi:hypothetical protein